jgi:hypothetical protein
MKYLDRLGYTATSMTLSFLDFPFRNENVFMPLYLGGFEQEPEGGEGPGAKTV